MDVAAEAPLEAIDSSEARTLSDSVGSATAISATTLTEADASSSVICDALTLSAPASAALNAAPSKLPISPAIVYAWRTK